jgi:hypothetical protein
MREKVERICYQQQTWAWIMSFGVASDTKQKLDNGSIQKPKNMYILQFTQQKERDHKKIIFYLPEL